MARTVQESKHRGGKNLKHSTPGRLGRRGAKTLPAHAHPSPPLLCCSDQTKPRNQRHPRPPAKPKEPRRPPMACCCDNMAAPPRVLIAPSPSDANRQGNVLSLRHPKSDEETSYLFIDGQLHEFNWFKERFGSWFLGDYVCEDGSLYYCTLVDPIFIFIPIFEAARMSNGKDSGKFRQLDEILYIEGYPGYRHLMSVAGNHMELVCEVKEVANVKFFRLDDSKVLSWLCCKVHNLKEVFPKLGKNYAAQGEKELLKDAVQIIREYLKDEPWLTLLCKKLQLDINEINAMTKISEASFYAESSPIPAPPPEGKVGNGSAKSSKGRPAKKQKIEVESKNIKDMFRRVTRKGT